MAIFKRQPPTSPGIATAAAANDGSEKKQSESYEEDVPNRNGGSDSYANAAIEKRVVRKLDVTVVPLVMVLYLLAFLDRSNIGNADIAGMAHDLDLSSDRYEWLLTIFYISYILAEPLVLMWKIVPPHYWAAFVVFIWGLTSTCLASVDSWQAAMALRFFMGASEAAYGPGIPYLLSFFYLRHEIGFRVGIFLAAAPLASTFAGALAFGITSGSPSIASWRLLFLVEGLPTICMSVVAFFFLPDSPAKASFLTEEEKVVAKARGVRQTGEDHRIGGVDFGDIGRTLLDAKAWFTALMYFSCNVSFASLPVFLPIILDELGFSSVNAQGLSAPPYFVSFLITITSAWIADRTQQRGYTVMALSAIGGTGYIILATTTSVGARYFAIFLVAGGVFPTIANILPWVLNNQGSDTRRGSGIVLLNVVGQCGPLLGTRLYPDGDAPRFVTGHSVCAAFLFFVTLLALSLRFLLVRENRKLDEQYGVLGAQAFDADPAMSAQSPTGEKIEANVAVENYGPSFRFVL